MASPSAPVLVTGATGRQGEAVTRALLAAGVPVRALVRDPHAPRAKAVETLGVDLVTGDLSDRSSLDPACAGVRAVFSVQMPPMDESGADFAAELAQATHLIEAARAAEVPQFVQSSTSGVGRHTETPGWAEGHWAAMEGYFATKQAIMEKVRGAGFARWTVIKPAFFMDNLPQLAPHGPEGGLATVLLPDTPLALVATEDIGAAAAHAVLEPDRFHEVELELAGEVLTMTEVCPDAVHRMGRSGGGAHHEPRRGTAPACPRGRRTRLEQRHPPARPPRTRPGARDSGRPRSPPGRRTT